MPGRHLLASAALVAALALPAPAALAQDETDEPVRIVVTGITDADFIANVFAVFLERQGYEVERIKADYSAQFIGLEAGDMDISTSIWDTSRDNMDAAIATGTVLNMGSTGVKIREGWWYPTYVEEVCPGLPDWTALKEDDCVEALSTIETMPMARYVEAPADWTTNNAERIEALDLAFQLQSAGTPAAMHATIVGAIQRGEPVIGWAYQPDWMTRRHEGRFVQFPPFEPACATDPSWGINPDAVWDCGNSDGYVWKVANAESAREMPRMARKLRLFMLSTEDVAWGINRIDLEGADSIDAATEWLDANPEKAADWAL